MNIGIPLDWLVYPAVSVLCYAPAMNGPPVFDDLEVLPNSAQLPMKWRAIRGAYRALGLFSLAVQRRWPATLRSIHIGNALIHAASGIVVAAAAAELGIPDEAAFCAGLLYVVHPFAANTVAYMSGRFSVLSTLSGLSGVLAVLTPGAAHLAVPALGLSFLSKEDGVGFAPVIGILAAWTGQWWLVASLAVGSVGFLAWKRRELREYLSGNGDTAMRQIGLPVSLPQPAHGYTILVETFLRLPLWTFGLGLSPYHGSGMPRSPAWRGAIALMLSWVYGWVIVAAPVPALLLLLGPWTVYLFCRTPDQICEYRSYSSLSGMALLGASVISGAWTWAAILICCALGTAVFAWTWSSEIRMWTAATMTHSGDPARAWGELGAYYKIKGEYFRSEAALRSALALNPGFGSALNNLSWILWQKRVTALDQTKTDPEGKARQNAATWEREAVATMEACTVKCPEYALGWQDLGKLYDGVNQPDAAENCYRRALQYEPRLAHSINRLGLAAFYAQDLPGARSRFEAAMAQQPGHWEFIYNHAVTLKHAGDMAGAAAAFARIPQPFPVTPNMIRLEFAK